MKSFIDEHRDAYGVEPIWGSADRPVYVPRACHPCPHPARAPARQRRDLALAEEVRRIWNENFQVDGVRKIWRQLAREGFDVARCTVARLMRQMGIRGGDGADGSLTVVRIALLRTAASKQSLDSCREIVDDCRPRFLCMSRD